MDILSVLQAPAVGLLDYLFYFLSLLIALTVIVFIHEYGHFKVARLCGVKVDIFSVGFGREIWGWTDSYQTRWKIGWLPLGGYVKFAGDANAASMPDRDAVKRPTQPGDFHATAVWKRALIVVAGPVANFILAAFLFIGAFYILGDQVPGTVVGQVQAGSPAEQAGIQTGDVIKSINGQHTESFDDIVKIVSTRPGETLSVVVDRSGADLTLSVVARSDIEDRGFYGKATVGRIGVIASRDAANFRTLTFGESIRAGVKQVWFIVDTTFRYIGKLFTGRDSVEHIGGLGSIAKATGDAASAGIFPFLSMIGFLSVSIGLINLFPIPMLDGGHLVFYAIEAIRRRPLGENAQEWGFRIGFAVVLFLMFIGNWNDLVKVIRQNVAL
ncbi:RIP metalloprotease RseP [soil metagenome]